MKFIKSKKGLVLLATLAVAAAAAIGAYAYFTSTGHGTGSASVGTNAALTITQTGSVTGMLPDSAAHSVSYTIDNTATFSQNLGEVTISNIATSDPTHCLASWFSANDPSAAVGTVAAGDTFTSGATTEPSIQMNDSAVNQDACKNATISFDLDAAQGS